MDAYRYVSSCHSVNTAVCRKNIIRIHSLSSSLSLRVLVSKSTTANIIGDLEEIRTKMAEVFAIFLL